MITSDLFPESFHPDNLGFNAVRQVAACFFSLRLDEQVSDRIVEQQYGQCTRLGLPRSGCLRRQLLHLTVAEWGVANGTRLDDGLHDAAYRFHFPAFSGTLVQTARFNGRKGKFALVLEADADTARQVHELREALADAQRWSGLIAERHAVRPHVTLGYWPQIPEETVVIPPIRFHVRQVDLIMSPGTSTHHVLDSWNLITSS